ncbi:MAG TPA: 50S ribosomal protein L9 [Dehalococcoidales bacterium]|jgi:large subunit ribosomal protein L9
MKVVFLEDVPNVAKAGDVKTVADGYGRNYLLPKKLAVVSKPGAETAIKAQIEARAETEQMKKLAAEIDGKELVFPVKAGAKERIHGSITAANIATQLQEVSGQAIDKRKIGLEEPIKALGSYDITIKLFKGIEPKIKVNVVKKEEEPPKEAIAPEAVTEAAVPEAGAELPKEPEA